MQFLFMATILLLPFSLTSAERVRDDWKLMSSALDLSKALDRTLGDAPLLTPSDREEVYKAVDDKSIHDSFTDNQRDEERKTVLSSPLGWVQLSASGDKQVVVRGPTLFCGASGNCSIWVFVHDRGKLRLVLTTGGNTFILKEHVTNGFHDLATYWHTSAASGGFSDYAWTGKGYQPSDCYRVDWDLNNKDAAPNLSDCPPRQ